LTAFCFLQVVPPFVVLRMMPPLAVPPTAQPRVALVNATP
jgi:hypothetical protein